MCLNRNWGTIYSNKVSKKHSAITVSSICMKYLIITGKDFISIYILGFSQVSVPKCGVSDRIKHMKDSSLERIPLKLVEIILKESWMLQWVLQLVVKSLLIELQGERVLHQVGGGSLQFGRFLYSMILGLIWFVVKTSHRSCYHQKLTNETQPPILGVDNRPFEEWWRWTWRHTKNPTKRCNEKSSDFMTFQSFLPEDSWLPCWCYLSILTLTHNDSYYISIIVLLCNNLWKEYNTQITNTISFLASYTFFHNLQQCC